MYNTGRGCLLLPTDEVTASGWLILRARNIELQAIPYFTIRSHYEPKIAARSSTSATVRTSLTLTC